VNIVRLQRTDNVVVATGGLETGKHSVVDQHLQ